MAGFEDIGGFIGSLVGYPLTAGDRRRQLQAIMEERDLYASLPVEIQAQLEQDYGLGPSAFENLEIDPRAAAAQYAALGRMREISDAGGLDKQGQARLAQVQASNAAQERAQRGAILDTFARRGMGNSNAALLASLTAQQGGAQRAGMEGLQAAGENEARAYRAIGDSAALGGQIRGQEYQQAADRASAIDRIAATNAANRQAVAQRNADRQNRTAEGNRATAYQRAGMQGGTYGREQDYYAEQERKKRALAAGVGQGVGAGVGYGFGPSPGGAP